MSLRVIHRWLALCILASVAPAKAEVDAVLDQVADHLSRIEQFHAEGVMRVVWLIDGERTEMDYAPALTFKRPNQMHATSGQQQIISDGTNVFLIATESKNYAVWPIVDSLEDVVLSEAVQAWSSWWPMSKSLISRDPRHRLDELKRFDVELLPAEEVDGHLCWVIRYESELTYFSQSTVSTVWVDQQTGVLRKHETRPKDREAAEAAGRALLESSYSLTHVIVNEDVDESLFRFDPGDEYTTFYGGQARSAGLMRFELSGVEAPDFELELLDGSTFRLSEHRGKIVVLDFWATWCGPCVRALPDVKKMDETYRGRGVVVVGVSRDRASDEKRVREMAEEHGLDYPIGIDTRDIATPYYVRGIPCVVVVDAEGVVQGRKVGYSTGGMKALAGDIDRLLAGEALDTAQPMTSEEIKEMQRERVRSQPARHTVMNEKFFKAQWETDIRSPGHSGRFGNRIQVRIVPPTFAVSTGSSVTVLRRRDGATVAEIPLPEEAWQSGEMRQRPAHRHVRHPDGGVVVSAQQFMQPRETDRGTTTWHLERTTLLGHNHDGEQVWSREFGDRNFIQSIDVIPVSEEEDVLLLAFWNRFLLVSAYGEELLDQSVAPSDRIDITQDPVDGRILFYVSGVVNGSYELVLPATAPDELP